MPSYPLAGVKVNPNGQTASISVTTATGLAVSVYSDPYGANPVTLPLSISATTAFYVGNGPLLVTATVSGMTVLSRYVTLEDSSVTTYAIPISSSNTTFPTYVIAASNSTAAQKAGANYVCTGSQDDVQINAAIAALPTNSILSGIQGSIFLCAGNYYLSRPVVIPGNVGYYGAGRGATTFCPDGTNGFTGFATHIVGVYWDNSLGTSYTAGTPTTTLTLANPETVVAGQTIHIGDGNVCTGNSAGSTNHMGDTVTIATSATNATTITINSWTPSVNWASGSFCFSLQGSYQQKPTLRDFNILWGVNETSTPTFTTGGYVVGGPGHGLMVCTPQASVENVRVEHASMVGAGIAYGGQGGSAETRFENVDCVYSIGDGIVIDTNMTDCTISRCNSQGYNSYTPGPAYGTYQLAQASGTTSVTSLVLTNPITVRNGTQLVIGTDTVTVSGSSPVTGSGATRGSGVFRSTYIPIQSHTFSQNYAAGTNVTVKLGCFLATSLSAGAITSISVVEPMSLTVGETITVTNGSTTDTFTVASGAAAASLTIPVNSHTITNSYTAGTGTSVLVANNYMLAGCYSAVDYGAHNQFVDHCHFYGNTYASFASLNGSDKFVSAAEIETSDYCSLLIDNSQLRAKQLDIYNTASAALQATCIYMYNCYDTSLDGIALADAPVSGAAWVTMASTVRRSRVSDVQIRNSSSGVVVCSIDSTCSNIELSGWFVTNSNYTATSNSLNNAGTNIRVHDCYFDRDIVDSAVSTSGNRYVNNILEASTVSNTGPASIFVENSGNQVVSGNQGQLSSGYLSETSGQAVIAASGTSVTINHGLGTYYAVSDAVASGSTALTSSGNHFVSGLATIPNLGGACPITVPGGVPTSGVPAGTTLASVSSTSSATASASITVSSGGIYVWTNPLTPNIGKINFDAVPTGGDTTIPLVWVSAVTSTTITFTAASAPTHALDINWSYRN